jgi:YidC/Oxa1 family membrane protein insertase
MSNEKRNLFLLVALSSLILFGFHYFYERPQLEAAQKAQVEQNTQESSKPNEVLTQITDAPLPPSVQTITIENGSVKGSFTNRGFEFSNLTLEKFKETTDPESPQVTLLAKKSGEEPGKEEGESEFYADFGWTSDDASLKLPTPQTIWETDNHTLSPLHPVVMTWDNGDGVFFKKVIEIDDNYMITIRQTIQNKTSKPLSFKTRGRVVRSNPAPSNYVVLHEGAIGYLENSLKEVKYDDLKKEKQQSIKSRGGWLGITDKYWLVALAPDQNISVETMFQATETRKGISYEATFAEPNTVLESGNTFTSTSQLFAGAKSLQLLDQYEKVNNIPHFDLAIDFGWFYFITKPLFFAIRWLFDLLGNFGLAIIVLTILVRLSFYPLANHSFHSMAKMRELQPQIARLKTVYGDDKVRFQQEMMTLYKKHGVNPVAGCVPILIQIPVFFALYKVLFVCIEMRHAPFYGWLVDLSAPDPTTIFNLFGLISWTPPSFLMIGVLPILMSLSMLLQQQLNPQPTDPIQEKVFKLMPLIFLFMLASFPAGLILYWICSNIFSVTQQWIQIKWPKKIKGLA